MSTITAGARVHTPVVIEGAESDSPSRTIVHDTLGGTAVVTLRPAGPSRGRVSAVFTTEAAARDLESDLRLAQTFTMVRDDLASDVVVFVPQGSVHVQLDTRTYMWTVSFEYVRVS
jgi:hypothetical protein